MVNPPHRLLTVLLSEHEEDLSRFAGFLKTTSVARATSEERVARRFRHRLPWLLLGLGGALLAADVVGAFATHLQLNLMLAFFIPGILSIWIYAFILLIRSTLTSRLNAAGMELVWQSATADGHE